MRNLLYEESDRAGQTLKFTSGYAGKQWNYQKRQPHNRPPFDPIEFSMPASAFENRNVEIQSHGI
jgi:hypothetical protein